MPATVRLLLAVVLALAVQPGFAETDSRAVERAIRLTNSGMRALERGDLDRATSQFEKALAVVDYFPDAYVGLGHAAMARRQYEAALAHFEQARDNYRRMASEILEVRAQRYLAAQRQITDLEDRLRQLDSASSRAKRPEGSGQSQRVGLEERIRQLRGLEPPAEVPTDVLPAEVTYYLGNALFQLERIDEAVAAWEDTLRVKPELPGLNRNLSVGYALLGRLDEARRAMARAEKLGQPVDAQLKSDLQQNLSGSAG